MANEEELNGELTPDEVRDSVGERVEVEKGDEAEKGDVGTEKTHAQMSEGSGSEKSKGKEAADAHPWQAVWDATRQAWYFWNSETQETTWTNPLKDTSQSSEGSQATGDIQAAETSSSSKPATSSAQLTDEEVASAHGIDPDLAYLDPALYASEVQQARIGSSAYVASGAFDSRTGKFVPLSARAMHDPSRLSHANQADRQMSAFFDVQEYQDERKRSREEKDREEAQGNKRTKAPTKKELQRYKERAKEKKAARYGWLRD